MPRVKLPFKYHIFSHGDIIKETFHRTAERRSIIFCSVDFGALHVVPKRPEIVDIRFKNRL